MPAISEIQTYTGQHGEVAYATEEDLRNRLAYLGSWLEQQGLNPWSASSEEE